MMNQRTESCRRLGDGDSSRFGGFFYYPVRSRNGVRGGAPSLPAASTVSNGLLDPTRLRR